MQKLKTQPHQYHTLHLRLDRLLRHHLCLALVLGIMGFGILSLDMRFRSVMQQAYMEGWSWIGTYMHHEHPAHTHAMFGISRAARISGPDD